MDVFEWISATSPGSPEAYKVKLHISFNDAIKQHNPTARSMCYHWSTQIIQGFYQHGISVQTDEESLVEVLQAT